MKHDDQPKPKCTGTTGKGHRCTKNAQDGSTRCAHHSFNVKTIGRPTKLTPELADRVVGLVLEGNYFNTAAQANGVSEQVLHRWLSRGADIEAVALEQTDPDAEDIDLYELVDPSLWVYLDFRSSLKAAEAWAETELLRKVLNTGYGPWQAHMTVLERRKPQHWRRRETHEVEHTGEVRTKPQTISPEDEERERVLAILNEAGALVVAGENDTNDEGDTDGND